MVMEIASYLNLECSSSDSEDQDESESIFDGHARVIWTSLAETIEKIDDILVVDRAFLHGDIVASVSEPSGQTGTVVNVDLTVDLKAPGGEIIRNVDSKNLVRVCAFAAGDYVIFGPWLGRVEEVDQNVTVLFNDNSECKIRRAGREFLIPISQNLLEDGYYPYYPGQRVRASSSAVFKNARWLRGRWKAGRMEGMINDVDVGSVHVKWIASAMPGCGSQTTTIPAEQQVPKQLTLLSCFSHANWQLGDLCLLTTNGDISGSVAAVVEDVVSSGDTEANMEIDCLKSGLGSTIDDGLHENKLCRSLMKHKSKVHKKGDVIEQALFVVNTKTKVDVVWQDGTHSFCSDSRTLFPVDNLGDHDFWPEQYVQEKGQDEDAVVSNFRRIGVVKSVDSKERTVRVKWLKPMQRPEDPREFDKEEVVSVYELAEHPDYSYCIGDIVILLPSVRETPMGSSIVNQFGQQKECQKLLEPEKDDVSLEPNYGERGLRRMKNVRGGGCVEESYLPFIGYVIGLKDGDIEVAWADGMVSKVGPHAIIVVARDEDMDSTQTSSEGDAEDDEDNAASLGTVESDGVYVNEKEQQVDEASSVQIDTHGHRGIASREWEVIAEESLNQNNSSALSVSQAAFKFVARLARGLLGFQGSKLLSTTANTSTQGETSQKHILDSTGLGTWQEKELVRGSQYHLSESVTTNAGDRLNTIDGSVAVLGGKEEAEVWTSKGELKDTPSRVEDQGQSFRMNLTDSGELTLNTVEKQQKNEDSLLNVYAHGNNEFKHFKWFDIVMDPNDHFFFNKTSQSISQHQWIKKVQEEWAILENNLPDTIFVRVYEDRMDLLRAAITGAVGTPYQDGLFFFDIRLPTEYPRVPPSVHYHSGGLRLNPNLYENGKICLSLLNTWTGRGNEVWDPVNSSVLQVLVSLQGLVLNAKPYFNEAGYDKQIGRAEAEKNSLAYNENSFLLSCKSMLYLLRKPPKHFESFVKEHFHRRGRYILGACNAYMKGTQVGCLSGETVMLLHDETVSQCSSSHGFKIMLDKLIPKLVSAFSEVGADCEEFLQVHV